MAQSVLVARVCVYACVAHGPSVVCSKKRTGRGRRERRVAGTGPERQRNHLDGLPHTHVYTRAGARSGVVEASEEKRGEEERKGERGACVTRKLRAVVPGTTIYGRTRGILLARRDGVAGREARA